MLLYERMKHAFPETVGHLERANATNRLAHAFLVEASSPKLRREFATALAMLGACPESRGGAPCCKCRTCRRIEEGDSPDVNLLFPQGKAYQIKVGEPGGKPEYNTMRYFEGQFYLTKLSQSRRKIGIILDADRMNGASQNAFLKTLEEPPPETLLILTTGSSSSLLPTTRSRCQSISLPEPCFIYDFPGRERLYDLLGDLAEVHGFELNKLEEAAGGLISLAGELKELARESVIKKYEARLQAAKMEDPAYFKRLEEESEDAAVGEYINIRREFLSAIQAFFAQLYCLSRGAEPEDLSNPEMFGRENDTGKAAGMEPGKALKKLVAAEELLRNLNYNINDELALRNFVFQTAG